MWRKEGSVNVREPYSSSVPPSPAPAARSASKPGAAPRSCRTARSASGVSAISDCAYRRPVNLRSDGAAQEAQRECMLGVGSERRNRPGFQRGESAACAISQDAPGATIADVQVIGVDIRGPKALLRTNSSQDLDVASLFKQHIAADCVIGPREVAQQRIGIAGCVPVDRSPGCHLAQALAAGYNFKRTVLIGEV